MIQAKRSFVKCGDCHGSQELEISSYLIVFFHSSVSLNNEKNLIGCKNSGDKIAVCERTACLLSGKFSDLNLAC